MGQVSVNLLSVNLHRSKFDPICSVNEISLGLLRNAHTLTSGQNGCPSIVKLLAKFVVTSTVEVVLSCRLKLCTTTV